MPCQTAARADPFDLQRFCDAQATHYQRALAELRSGRKQSHWIWFVLPQLRGLGYSAMAQHYGIASLAEARAYLAHPLLGVRLLECVDAMLAQPGERTADGILGSLDALKFRSCLTLFACAGPEHRQFVAALERFFGGEADKHTLALLGLSSLEEGRSAK